MTFELSPPCNSISRHGAARVADARYGPGRHSAAEFRTGTFPLTTHECRLLNHCSESFAIRAPMQEAEMSREIQQMIFVAAVLAAAALLGLGFGRLLRESLPTASTPRTARAREFLRACYNANITPEARLLSSFESVYFCCVDVAERIGMAPEGLDHPDINVVEAALRALGIPEKDSATVHALLEWRVYPISSQPRGCTEDTALTLAKMIYIKTLKYLRG